MRSVISRKEDNMAKQTVQEKICEWLAGRGFEEVKPTTIKYRRFKSNKDKESFFYFVGKRGAVRVGRVVSSSFSVTDRIKQMMKADNV